jgi:hypothetical protein
MNARILAAFLLCLTASTGCIIIDHDHDDCCDVPAPTPTYPGDVTFLWTFPGSGAGRCADVPDVKRVRITIPGETLHNGGVYACNTAGVDGIVLHDFVPGNYGYTLEALSYTDEVLYRASGNFTVNGDQRLNVTLTPNGSPGSFAYVSWTFEGNTGSANPTCAQAGVNYVDVRIDNGTWERLSCDEGIGSNQVSSPYLAPGAHTIEFVGVHVVGTVETPYYYRRGTLNTVAGSPVSVSYQLWVVGGMSVAWDLYDGSLRKTCAQSGVTAVTIHLYDETDGTYVYGTEGETYGCGDAAIVYNFLRPGYYTVIMDARGPGGIYYTNRGIAPSLQVKPYVQRTKDDYTVVNLRRQ